MQRRFPIFNALASVFAIATCVFAILFAVQHRAWETLTWVVPASLGAGASLSKVVRYFRSK